MVKKYRNIIIIKHFMCEIYESQYLRQNCNWKNVHCARSLVTDIGKAEEWMYQPKKERER